MKICALSDLHGNLPQLEPCDVVCICGDIAPINFDRSTDRCIYWFRTVFLKWCSKLECEKVIFIAGNHDFFLDLLGNKTIFIIKEYELENKVIYLENSEYVYNNVRFYGCPNVENLAHWAYYTPDGMEYRHIPENTDVLLTHMAPKIGEIGRDLTVIRDFGSLRLAKSITSNRKIKYAFCGHIHDGDHTPHFVNDTTLVNVAILNDDYEIAYNPFYTELILLPNRYNDHNFFIFQNKDDDDLYNFKLVLENNLGHRIIGENEAFDPSGGPFIGLGYNIQYQGKDLQLINFDASTLMFTFQKYAKDKETT